MLVVFSMDGCASCVAATKLLAQKGVAHRVVKVDEDLDAAAFIRREGHRSLPQIYQDGKLFVTGGFEGLKKHFAS